MPSGSLNFRRNKENTDQHTAGVYSFDRLFQENHSPFITIKSESLTLKLHKNLTDKLGIIPEITDCR